MAAAGFGWTTLDVSRERSGWLRAAGGVSFALAAALASGLASEPSIGLALGVLAALAAAGISLGWAVRPVQGWALCIDADGTIWTRMVAPALDETGAPVRLSPQMVGTRLVVLAAGRRVVAVWRDALPPAHFRRLCAHARWHVERAEGAVGLSPAAPDDGN
jgi:hypothetical protein